MSYKSSTQYYRLEGTEIVGIYVNRGGGSYEFIWFIHPFDWYKTQFLVRDDFGNILNTDEFRQILLMTTTWNMANIGRTHGLEER